MKNILEEILESPKIPEGIVWQRRTFKVNEKIVTEGDPGISLFYINSGVLRVTGKVQLSMEKNIKPGMGDLIKGDIFGESSLLSSFPRIASVISITKSELIEINGERLSIYLDDHPTQGYLFYKFLLKVFIDRLKKSNHTVESLIAWGIKAHEIDRYL